MNEIYRPIKDNPRYMVSNRGQITNPRTGELLKPKKNKKTGYLSIQLRKSTNSKCKEYLIHRLVAETFCNRETEKHNEVNHKDGNKENNDARNLEWVTRNQNLRHAYESGLRKDDVSAKAVIARDMATGAARVFSSIYEAAKTLGISQGNICMCCKGKRPYANGYFWEYQTLIQEGE